MRAPALAAILGLLLVELHLAHQALARPEPWQVGLELLGLLASGAAWLWLAPPAARHPAWVAVAATLLTALATRPAGWVQGFVFAVGALVLALAVGRVLAERLRPGRFGGLALGIAAGLLVRYQVLLASDVRDARAQLLAELADPWPRAPAPRAEGPPLVLISVDTLRWDHAVRTRAWARLVEGGAGWPRGMATSSWTLPSMTSALTGLPAELHGAGATASGLRSASAPTLAEALRAAGYSTHAIVTNPFCSRDTGLDRGFDRFLHAWERAPHRLLLAGWPAGAPGTRAERVVDRALGWLEQAPDAGFFLWVHLLDPHLPYGHLPPGHPLDGWRRSDLRGGRVLDEATREAVRRAYAAEVEAVDAQLLRLLDALDRWPEATVVFVADHGEELWDHGDFEHGHSHHGEVVDVAIAVSGPGVAVAGPQGVASLVDVAPTLRAAAGLDPGGLDLRRGVPPDRVATAFGNKYDRVDRSARQGALRLIAREDGARLAFDLQADPHERHPFTLPEDHPLSRAVEGAAAEGQDAAMNTEALRALGYLD